MPRRILQGVVVSSTEKTVVIKVERKVTHERYKKIIRSSKKYMAHDEKNASKVGDVVRIVECPPKSRRKRWEVIYEAAATSTKKAPAKKAAASDEIIQPAAKAADKK